MISILGFLAILAPLVIVHEFGHFFFAKLFNVKAEAFSVGFGPRVFKKQIGETEFSWSLLPLGGYVKLLGEDPSQELSAELKPRALQYQAPWKRFFIFFGGPLFNFLWAIIVFMTILVVGEDQIANVVGRAVPGTPAYVSGLRSGDTILNVNGAPVSRFYEIAMKVADLPDQVVALDVLPKGSNTPVKIEVKTESVEGYSMYGAKKRMGKISGLDRISRSLKVGVSRPDSIVGKLGIVTGDEIIEVAGQKVRNFEELDAWYMSLPAGPTTAELKLKKGQDKSNFTVNLSLPAVRKGLAEDLGLFSSELFIDQSVEGTPAKIAGLERGDRLDMIDGSPVLSFEMLRGMIQKGAEKFGKVSVRIERKGDLKTLEITPTKTVTKDPSLEDVAQYTIGVVPMLEYGWVPTIHERVLNPFVLLYRGTSQMFEFIGHNVTSISKMFSGEVSVKTLGGPIAIGKIAGDSIERGLVAFLKTMAMLSVGLGFLNLLPIPVLDGGHLMMLSIEIVRGRPLTIRQMEVLQQVGLSLLVLLMVVVMKNDISRLPFFQ